MKTFFVVLPFSLQTPDLRPDRFDYLEDAQASAIERTAAHPGHGGYVVCQTIAHVEDPKAEEPFATPAAAVAKPEPDVLTPDFVRGNVGGQPVPDPELEAKIAALKAQQNAVAAEAAEAEPSGAGNLRPA